MHANALAIKKVGELACQMSSYLKSITASVVSCTEVKGAKGSTAYELVLTDSVLFPEGGGQPCDLGFVGEVPVTNVQRRGDECVLTVPTPLDVGAAVTMSVDWQRRVDHMQHHTAQHVVTAVVEKELGLPTMSWALSHPTCYIQLPTAKIDEADVKRVEALCNSMIAARVPVTRVVYASKEELPPSRSRGIPADVTGPIRLIDVEGHDTCTCCGTHVENLSELHAIKLLHQEPKGNTCRLHFIAGCRIVEQFSELYDNMRLLVKELGTNQENVLAATKRRGDELSLATKQNKRLLAELAPLVAQSALDAFDANVGIPFLFHRADADVEFLATVTDLFKARHPEHVAVLACGAAEGQFLVIGPTDKVQLVATQIAEDLQGKGGLSKAGFRGKGNMKLWKNVIKRFRV